jgi:HD-GYP domain-containing protein (c-di-GMP phosphodiesterase class II)
VNKEKVFVEDLKPGMFVSELDRPWQDTPFAFQGFVIRSSEHIEALRRYCKYVYIDPLKGSYTPTPRNIGPNVLAATPEEKASSAVTRKKVVYEDKIAVEVELGKAKAVRNNLTKLATSIQEEIQKGGVLGREKLQAAVEGMIDSVIRNPDALLLLTKLKEKDAWSYGRSVDVAIYLLAFGRHLGLPREELQILGFGGLLLDIGKIRLPKELLTKNAVLSAEEHRLMKSHVEHSMDILNHTSGIPAAALDMVATHHELEDGSGYPKGLKGQKISLYGKMAAIADCFEGLLSRGQPLAPPVPPYVALQLLYEWRSRFFQENLVEEFIQCMGVYPVGSLVELSTGEVAVVIAHNRTRRLKPRIILILDPQKKPYPDPRMVDLNAPQPSSQSSEIRRGLEYGMYGIDPKAYYL